MYAKLTGYLLALFALHGVVMGATLRSPDGRIEAEVYLKDEGPGLRSLMYTVRCGREDVVTPSGVDLLAPASLLSGKAVLTPGKVTSRRDTWRPVCGERTVVTDAYNECPFTLRTGGDRPVEAKITFRCYDSGVAFRCTIVSVGPDKRISISREASEFRFNGDPDCWATYSAQGIYSKVPLSKVRPECERPLVIRVNPGLFAAIGEAALVDYARMRLAPAQRGGGVVSHVAGVVESELPLTTPWRLIMIGTSPGALLEGNDLVRNLNAACAIKDTSWIRPGKVIREVTLTTDGGKACVDFAAANGLQYVEFDAGWYGHEYDDTSDARTITLDPKRSKGPLDLQGIVRYGESKGVGIIVYVNRRALERQLDELLPLYRSWGIKGLKYGFVNVGSQHWTRWLHDAIRKAADHEFMVDVHDEYRPTGYARTYPNLMTMEGIRGDEARPPASQTLTTLFTRMLAGAGDNTICYYNGRVDELWSHGFQLAKSVCLFSPWQFLYWYDRPLKPTEVAAGVQPSGGIIGQEPELEFFAKVPTTWDETRVIAGAIGEHASIARRKGDDWFVGCMNGDHVRTFTLPLTFLDADGAFTARIYTDDPAVSSRTHVKIEERPVDARTTLAFLIKPHHGVAMRIVRN